MPPATSSVRSRRWADAVNTPNGPSVTTRVPGRIDASPALWSPSALTVIRSDRPSGASDSENGWAVHQCVGEEPPEEELSRPRAEAVEVRPEIRSGRLRALGHDLGDAQPVAEGADDRRCETEDDDQGERRDVQALPVVVDHGVEHELVAGGDLVNQASAIPA